jgi:hypothetical protein
MFMLFIDVSNNPDAILDQQAIDDEFYAAALRELVSIGLDVTRIIHQQIVAHSLDSPHSPVPEATSLAYERVTRAARRAIMLAKRHNAIPRDIPGRRPKPGAAPAKTAPKDAGKDAEHPDRPDRPESPDRLDELDDRPTIELINELRQELGHPPIEPKADGAPIAPSRCGTNGDETIPDVARIAPSRCGTNGDETTPDVARIAPPRCGTNGDETTPPQPPNPNKGPPYPPGS